MVIRFPMMSKREPRIVECAVMNSIPMTEFFPIFLFSLPTFAWYLAVIVMLYKILQELKRIRA